MTYLIIYMSRHGTTAKVAAEIKEKLGTEKTTLVDLEKDQVPSLDEFPYCDHRRLGACRHDSAGTHDILY